jgi:sulfur carrier protein ThiS
MNKQMFRDYIDCFNRDDFAGFSRYYTDDVVLELPKKELRGPQAIVDFYRVVKARIRETLQINEVVADDEGLAAEVDTEFLALEDWPDFIVRPVKKGDSIRIVSFVHYKIRDGRFAHIKSARFRTLSA